MIKTAIKFQNNMVVVFDRRGRQIPKYQAQYKDIKESILTDAPPDTVFCHGLWDDFELKVVPRDEW